MTGVHMLIGIGEGLISAMVFLAIQRTRPELISTGRPAHGPGRLGELIGYGSLVTLGVAVFIAPFACSWPDGLDSVAAKWGVTPRAVIAHLPAPAPDYQIPGMHWAVGATALAGAIGVFVVFGLALLLGRWLVPTSTGGDGSTPL